MQSEVFPEEVRLLAAGKRPKGQSALVGCCLLLLDKEDGLIKVKGRTVEATNFSNSIPVLPTKHRFVDLLIKDAHERRAHSWVEDTYNQISYHVWILRGRQRVKSVLNECMVCRMLSKRPVKQPTGQLPGYRCNVGEPFETTGVDFFGPLFVKKRIGSYGQAICLPLRVCQSESRSSRIGARYVYPKVSFRSGTLSGSSW